MNSFRKLYTVLLFISGLLVSGIASAADLQGPYRSSLFGVAAEGYDVVSYFKDSKAVEGTSGHSVKWQDVEWLFSSAANKQAFSDNPEKFAPQYGGYCAYAVAIGATASIDPEAWKIVDGKLYLNYSKGVQNTWEQNISGYIKSANGHWPNIRKSL
ncbi:hypothetical protein A9Q83_14270 [Alphaproteobacteria bacterium 46_93_T64]|nr:hypothetical protein A9Q83_14270 [Alphaproteobacteria bacterium 46_93_T64]